MHGSKLLRLRRHSHATRAGRRRVASAVTSALTAFVPAAATDADVTSVTSYTTI